jgi:hypothetical protein
VAWSRSYRTEFHRVIHYSSDSVMLGHSSYDWMYKPTSGHNNTEVHLKMPRTPRGSGVRSGSRLRHCATSWNIARSIPDGVTGIFH